MIAAVVFLATRPHEDRDRQPLIDAIEATFARGGTVIVTDYKDSPSLGEQTRTSELTTSPGTDPDALQDDRSIVRAVRDAVDVESLGSETLQGIPTTHYVATVDNELPDSIKDRPSQLDAWIDASGLLRRYKLEDWLRPATGEPLDSYLALDFQY